MMNNLKTLDYNPVRTGLLFLVLIGLVSCGAVPSKQEADEVPTATAAVQPDISDVDDDVVDDFDRALQMLQTEDYDQAITLLKSVTTRDPRLTAPLVNMGMAYMRKGDNKQAEEVLHQALKLDLGHDVANNELGRLYRQAGRFDEAKKAYMNALAAHPEYLPARKNLGILCEIYMHDDECALDHFEQYQTVDPDDKTVNLWVEDLRRRLGR
jgi:Flp pilus assembly protein TadD